MTVPALNCCRVQRFVRCIARDPPLKRGRRCHGALKDETLAVDWDEYATENILTVKSITPTLDTPAWKQMKAAF